MTTTPAHLEAAAWNAQHPVGTPVRWYITGLEGLPEDEGWVNDFDAPCTGVTRSGGWVACGVAVVLVEGIRGAVALRDVEVMGGIR